MLTVGELLEGFDGFGSVVIKIDDVEVRDGTVVSGRVEELDFVVFAGDEPESSLEVEDLDGSLIELLKALDVPAPADRLEALTEFVFGGDDVVTGSRSDDFIIGAGGDDRVTAGAGNDVILAGSGTNTIDGGDQSPRSVGSIDGLFGEDSANGDLVSYATDAAGVIVDLARGEAIKADGDVDRLVDVEGAAGGSGKDKLRGDGGDNFFIPGLGADRVDGRGGFDVVSYRVDSYVLADLAKGKAAVAVGGVDRLTDVEGVIGSIGDDRIFGGRGDNLLGGGFAGQDVLRGRGGADDFVFSFDQGGVATIKDFVSGEDRLLFDGSEFGLTARFKLAIGDDPVAEGRLSRLLYDVDARELWVDADGAGAGEARLVAKLSAVGSVAIEDFALI